MVVTSPLLSFESPAFADGPGADGETNPGIFGRRFAEWISGRLKERGLPALDAYAEDWGWCVELDNHKHRTGLACGSGEGPHQLRVYAFVDLGLLGALRGRDDALGIANDLLDEVRDLLLAEPTVSNVRVEQVE